MQEWPTTWVNESSYVFREKKTQKWLTIYEDKKTVQLECAVCGWRIRKFIGDDMHKECPNIKNHPKEEKKMDDVNHPKHYTQGKIEVIDFIEDQEMTYFIGNATKYLCRYRYKGDPVKDLEKALFYINRQIEQLKQRLEDMKE